MRPRATAFAAFAGAMLVCGAASAHPHVFAESHMEIVGNADGTLKAVRNVWRMDELFSSSVVFDFDKNANGQLDEDELAEVGKVVKESIAEWDFYTFVKVGTRDVTMAPPDEIRMNVENGQLIMFFEMAAGEPVDLKKDALTVFNWDETFYVAFDYPDDTAFQLVDLPANCGKKLVVPDEDEAASAWMDSIAALGPDEEVPSDGVDYSLLLATRTEVSCAAAS